VESRRLAIARLLFNLYGPLYDPSAPDLLKPELFRRYVAVVGLNVAAEPIYKEAETLLRIAGEVDPTERSRNHSLFEKEHRTALARSFELADQVEENRVRLLAEQEEKRRHEVQLKERQIEVNNVKEELNKSREETALRLAELRGKMDSLFKIRVELRDATQENQKLEKDIRALEAGR